MMQWRPQCNALTYLAIVHIAVAKSDLQELQSANLTIAIIIHFGKQLVCEHDPESKLASVTVG